MKASIVIPTFNRPELLARAVGSARGQTMRCEVVVSNTGASRVQEDVRAQCDKVIELERDECYLGWALGAAVAAGEAMVCLADDDWLEPTFLERTLPQLDEGTAWVGARATLWPGLSQPERSQCLAPPGLGRFGRLPARWMWRAMRDSLPWGISPHSVLMRRRDFLDALMTAVIPGNPWDAPDAGPLGADYLVLALPLLRYPQVVFLSDPLANFGEAQDSVSAAASRAGRSAEMVRAYDHVRVFAELCRLAATHGSALVRVMRLLRGSRWLSRPPKSPAAGTNARRKGTP